MTPEYEDGQHARRLMIPAEPTTATPTAWVVTLTAWPAKNLAGAPIAARQRHVADRTYKDGFTLRETSEHVWP